MEVGGCVVVSRSFECLGGCCFRKARALELGAGHDAIQARQVPRPPACCEVTNTCGCSLFARWSLSTVMVRSYKLDTRSAGSGNASFFEGLHFGRCRAKQCIGMWVVKAHLDASGSLLMMTSRALRFSFGMSMVSMSCILRQLTIFLYTIRTLVFTPCASEQGCKG
jgi:hypothetical protein